jgi:hypothetical protein
VGTKVQKHVLVALTSISGARAPIKSAARRRLGIGVNRRKRCAFLARLWSYQSTESHVNITQEFADMSSGLVAAIRLMNGARRRSAEARLSRTIESMVEEHSPDVLFARAIR